MMMNTHVEPEDLLRLADNELPRDRASEVGEHVRDCEQCRTELNAYLSACASYTAYHIDALKRNVPPPPKPWARLEDLNTPLFMDTQRKPLPYKWIGIAACLTVILVAQSIRLVNRNTQEVVNHPAAPAPARPVSPEPLAESPAPPQAQQPGAIWLPGPAEELRLFVALNRIGADLGEAIEVKRSEDSRQIVVTGVGLDSSREAQVRSVLESIPGVAVRFVPAALPPASLDAGAGGSTARRVANPLQQELERKLGGAAEADAYTDRVLAGSDAAIARAHALDKLARRFSPEVESVLSSEDRALLRDLAGQHIGALRNISSRLQSDIAMLFDSPVHPSNMPSCSGWQGCADSILNRSRELDSALGNSLAGSNAPDRSELRRATSDWFAAVDRISENVK